MTYRPSYGVFPRASAILFGIGLGAFFDSIVFEEVLQWHHMISSWYPPTSLDNIRLNIRWDGFFHSATYLCVVLAVALFWRKASTRELYWSSQMLSGGMFMGWGAYNLVEGIVGHALLGIHHFNETVPASQRAYWDLAFLACGALMLLGGRLLERQGDRRRKSRDLGVAYASKAAG